MEVCQAQHIVIIGKIAVDIVQGHVVDDQIGRRQ